MHKTIEIIGVPDASALAKQLKKHPANTRIVVRSEPAAVLPMDIGAAVPSTAHVELLQMRQSLCAVPGGQCMIDDEAIASDGTVEISARWVPKKPAVHGRAPMRSMAWRKQTLTVVHRSQGRT